MLKACSRCGKIHSYNYKCNVGRVYKPRQESKARDTYAWEKKSIEIRERANYLCEVCRDNNIYIYNKTEVHHITKLRDDESLLLDNYNLVCLCQKHHKEADKGKIDADYLRELARKREDECWKGNNTRPVS